MVSFMPGIIERGFQAGRGGGLTITLTIIMNHNDIKVFLQNNIQMLLKVLALGFVAET